MQTGRVGVGRSRGLPESSQGSWGSLRQEREAPRGTAEWVQEDSCRGEGAGSRAPSFPGQTPKGRGGGERPRALLPTRPGAAGAEPSRAPAEPGSSCRARGAPSAAARRHTPAGCARGTTGSDPRPLPPSTPLQLPEPRRDPSGEQGVKDHRAVWFAKRGRPRRERRGMEPSRRWQTSSLKGTISSGGPWGCAPGRDGGVRRKREACCNAPLGKVFLMQTLVLQPEPARPGAAAGPGQPTLAGHSWCCGGAGGMDDERSPRGKQLLGQNRRQERAPELCGGQREMFLFCAWVGTDVDSDPGMDGAGGGQVPGAGWGHPGSCG